MDKTKTGHKQRNTHYKGNVRVYAEFIKRFTIGLDVRYDGFAKKRLKLHLMMNLRKQTEQILTNLRFATEDFECKTNMSERVFSTSAPVHY